jgi:hypothetical protein
MPLALTEIEEQWAAEFPGVALLIVVLRSAVAFADWSTRQIQAQFLQLHNDLLSTGLPMQFWDRDTRQTYQFMERAHARAQRELRQALRALQASYTKPEPVKPPPKPPGKVDIRQTLYVTVEDGVAKTKTDMDAAYFCAIPPEPLEVIGNVIRIFSFQNGVPDCYASLLTDEGVTHEPQNSLLVGYPLQDFLRLCREEIATSSPHVLDDEDCRIEYRWSTLPADTMQESREPQTGENR